MKPLRLFTVLTLALTSQIGIAGDVIPPPLDRPYDQVTWLATHNSYSNPDEGLALHTANQLHSITDQLNYGVRVLNPDVWLVRQELVGVRFLGNCKCEFEEYPNESTTPKKRFKDLPLEVVVAHGTGDQLVGGLLEYCTEWKSFTQVLTEIRQWVEEHPQEVITIVLENKVAFTNQVYVNRAFTNSGLQKYIFYPDRNNPDVPAPPGRMGGWMVSQYGYPTLRELVKRSKTVVRAVDNPDPERAGQWYYDVSTVFGAKSLIPNTWTDPRTESWPLNDFTRRTFAMLHIPDLPQEVNYEYEPVNSIFLLRDKWADIRARWNRLPNWVFVDYYDKGLGLGPTKPPGPAQFVNELNEIWNRLPTITPIAEVVPPPSSNGWHNTDVQVTLSGSGDTIQAITSRTFGAQSSDVIPTSKEVYTISSNGVTTVTFSAVGDLGNRSATELVRIAIDKVPPTITGTLDRPPDHAGWYTSNVTAHFECSDVGSGVESCQPDVVLSQDGAGQQVTGVAVDRAGNQSTTTITNINIDTEGPVIRAEANPTSLRPPNGKPALAVISGTITDAGSGVDPATATYEVSDEYDRVEPSGRIVLGRGGKFSFLLRLEARRFGQDRNGRLYIVYLNATDRAGHTSQTAIHIVVPHDNRNDNGNRNRGAN